jgi:hypothetical protein
MIQIGHKTFSENEFSDLLHKQIETHNLLKSVDIQQVYNCDLQTFVRYSYAALTPNETGFKMVNFLSEKFKFHEIGADVCRGDFYLMYKKPHGAKYIEVKTSRLSKYNQFGIRNIRRWHKIDYYLICLMPSPNDSPLFYLVTLEDLEKKFSMTYMNGNAEENSHNKLAGQGISFCNTPTNLNYLDSINVLKGSSYRNLIEYVSHNTYVPYGFDGTIGDSEPQPAPKKVIRNTKGFGVNKTEQPLDDKTKKNTRKRPVRTNLQSFSVDGKSFNKKNFTQNYVDFYRDVFRNLSYPFDKIILRDMFPSYIVQDIKYFPPSTQKKPFTIHKLDEHFYISTNNSSNVKKEMIQKFANLIRVDCDFYVK